VYDALVAEIDAFIEGYKTLGYLSAWSNRSYGNEWQARCSIEDASGTQRGELCLSIDLALQRPSIVAIYEGNMFYRVDVVPPYEREPNPYSAMKLGLPKYVYGSHAHSWSANREWCRVNGFLGLPHRVQLDQSVNDFGRALEAVAAGTNIVIMPSQWEVPLPASTLV